jgi:UDP-N-acetylmuramate--alanine ligase
MKKNHNHISRLLLNYKGTIHFSGIGGIGMSGIAEILHNLGFKIQGSDISENANTKRLADFGIKIFIGQIKDNLKDASLMVKSTAVKENNPEFVEARTKKIPIVTRTEMLAELMRLKISVAISGSHGKTTTTSLVAAIFENAGLKPTVINGGIINTHGTNAYLGDGDYLVAEADESDATFIKIPSTIGVVTNIDPEHLDYYGTFEELKKAFETFISNLPFYGFGVLCIDHPVVKEMAEKTLDRKVITYSMKNDKADIVAKNVRHEIFQSIFDVKISEKINYPHREIKNIKLPIPGIHNISNALAGIAIATELNIDKQKIITAFENFKGVKRRFTYTGEYKGIKFFDDYAHHPEEVKATLHTAREVANNTGGKVIAIFQPHRYSRTKDLFNEFVKCFTDADIIYIADIYAASEEPIPTLNKELIVNAIKQSKSHKDARLLESPDDLVKIVKDNAEKNDIVIFMGAGSITKWANEIPEKLKK